MPGNAFIRFKEITKGESTHETHPGTSGWIEISDWSWDIEADTSSTSVEEKVINNRPADVNDACFNNAGATDSDLLVDVGLDSATCQVGVMTKTMSSPHVVAGGPLAENVFKCQLKPLNVSDSDYRGTAFTPNQVARLAAVFPNGVCDWTKPGVGQTDAVPTTFADGPGGQPLPPPPEATH